MEKQYLEKLKKTLNDDPEIHVAYLFGSSLKKSLKEANDVDIAVFFSDQLDKYQMFNRQLELMDKLQTLLQKEFVDVVVLNQTKNILLKREAIAGHHVLVDNVPEKRFELEAMIRNTYYDDLLEYQKMKAIYGIIVDKKIRRIEQLYHEIDTLGKIDEIQTNPVQRGFLEFHVIQMIQLCLDIGHHIISDQKFREPEFSRDVFEILYENKLISENLAKSLQKMIGFRNLLVHDYLEIDLEIEQQIFRTSLGEILSFVNEIKSQI